MIEYYPGARDALTTSRWTFLGALGKDYLGYAGFSRERILLAALHEELLVGKMDYKSSMLVRQQEYPGDATAKALRQFIEQYKTKERNNKTAVKTGLISASLGALSVVDSGSVIRMLLAGTGCGVGVVGLLKYNRAKFIDEHNVTTNRAGLEQIRHEVMIPELEADYGRALIQESIYSSLPE